MSAVCQRQDEIDSHEEGAAGLLEGGDGTVGMREGGLQMSDDVCGGPVRGRHLWRRTEGRQSGADLALAVLEALPQALPGAIAAAAVKDGVDGKGDAASDGASQETPEGVGGEAEAADFVGVPNAKGASATRAGVAIAAKDAASTHGWPSGAAIVKAAHIAVPNQRADPLAMRTRRLLEPFGNGVPFLGVAEKPALLAHGNHASTKSVILATWKRRGVKARYDETSLSGVRGKIPAWHEQPRHRLCQILGVTAMPQSDANSGTFAQKRDQSEGKDTCVPDQILVALVAKLTL